MSEEKTLTEKPKKTLWDGALKMVKGENTNQLIEQFTAEMTLVAEGLCEDQTKLRREVDNMTTQEDRRIQKLDSRIDLLETSLDEERRAHDKDVTELRNGAARTVQKKMFPGYVLIHMVMNEDTWFIVRNTRGVTGFVGPGSKPVPLSETEVTNLSAQSDNIQADFQVGDAVIVVNGVCKDRPGVIRQINPKKRMVTVIVNMFDRDTPVELEFSDIRKV